MKRTPKQNVETTSVIDHPLESAPPLNHAPIHHANHLEAEVAAKREQFYAQYEQMRAVKGWNAGYELNACEKALEAHLGAAHALLFCTEAASFQVLLEALELKASDCLYLPENIAHHLYEVAAKMTTAIHLIDVEPVSRKVDLASLSTKLRSHPTRGRDVIVVSHVAGGVFPVDELEQLICDPDTIIIEDATEAFGAKDPAEALIGSSHRSTATLCGFSDGRLAGGSGAGAVTTRDGQLAKRLRTGQARFALSFPQAALLLQGLTHVSHLLQSRKDLLARYLIALREAFHGTSKDREPRLAESLLEIGAAPSALLLRVDCVQLGMRQERIVSLFAKAGLKADWGQALLRPSSCFTSLRVELDPSFNQNDLINLFRAFRDVLVRS